jgi:mannose-1-phosphate guanylyltransferase/mannose-6-phosphate isomerase
MIIPIILAGGTGSRLWPSSREHFPKQLLTLVGENSLLQETIKRTQSIAHVADPIVICNRQYRFLVAEQMLEMGIESPQLILEPTGRNTAPAIAMAAFLAQRLSPHTPPLLLILPADHIIPENDRFLAAIEASCALAEAGHLLTFGIEPTYPETGYGYIQSGAEVAPPICKVTQFIEKPKKSEAEAYLKTGQYYWNSGLFLFAANRYLEELNIHRPDIYKACATEAEHLTEVGGFFNLSDTFSSCPSESIDYAVMEKTARALMYPLKVTWSDVGSWTALYDVLPRDKNANILQGDVTCIDTHNCMIRAEHRLIATVGLKDMIVIETKDAVMVAHKDHAQKVKDLVAQLKMNQRKDLT